MAAVFAALVLAWACFVACSNSSSDSGSNGAAVQALQGLWIDKEGDGFYFVGNICYDALYYKNYYYCIEGEEFSISGNKLRIQDYKDVDEYDFTINGNTLNIKYYNYNYINGSLWNTETEIVAYKKVANLMPIGIPQKEFITLLR